MLDRVCRPVRRSFFCSFRPYLTVTHATVHNQHISELSYMIFTFLVTTTSSRSTCAHRSCDNVSCSFGFDVDYAGCPTCSCRNPCSARILFYLIDNLLAGHLTLTTSVFRQWQTSSLWP